MWVLLNTSSLTWSEIMGKKCARNYCLFSYLHHTPWTPQNAKNDGSHASWNFMFLETPSWKIYVLYSPFTKYIIYIFYYIVFLLCVFVLWGLLFHILKPWQHEKLKCYLSRFKIIQVFIELSYIYLSFKKRPKADLELFTEWLNKIIDPKGYTPRIIEKIHRRNKVLLRKLCCGHRDSIALKALALYKAKSSALHSHTSTSSSALVTGMIYSTAEPEHNSILGPESSTRLRITESTLDLSEHHLGGLIKTEIWS